MINGKRVLIVIPAWNEEASVGHTVGEVRGELPDVDVLVVDDGSGDRTCEVAREAGAIIARLPYNLGVGGAMRLGYRYGYEHGYEYVVKAEVEVPVVRAQLPQTSLE